MKTILFLFAVLIFGLASCNNANRGVEINGVRWATSNVETPGTFARNPESAGGFFTFEEAQNACPRGWRLPTSGELRSLLDAACGARTTVNEVRGLTFGTAPYQLFLPAAGWPNTAGALNNVHSHGFFWSSGVSVAGTGWFEFFGHHLGSTFVNYPVRRFNVRCVAE